MAGSPTQKTLKLLRELGYWAEDVTAYYHPKAASFPRKKDVLGFADILAFRSGELMAVNATSKNHVADHKTKYSSSRALIEWLNAGGHMAIHGWSPDEYDEEARIVSAYLDDGRVVWT